MANHQDHMCRFNDGAQTCDCYDAGFKAAENRGLEKAAETMDVSVHVISFNQDGTKGRIEVPGTIFAESIRKLKTL